MSMKGQYLMQDTIPLSTEPPATTEDQWSPSILRIYKEAKGNYLYMVKRLIFLLV